MPRRFTHSRPEATGRNLTIRLPLLSALAVATFACSDVVPGGDEVTTTDSAGVRITTIGAEMVRALPEWRLAATPGRVPGAEATGDSTSLARIGPVRWLGDGALVVTDLGESRLHVFDSTGMYRRSLGRRGEGPGEFRAITSVTPLRHDTLAIFDASQRRLTVWSVSGGLVRQVSLRDAGALDAWPADAWPWRDSLVVVLQLAVTPRPVLAAGATVRRWPMRAQLALRDTTGRVLANGPAFEGMYTAVYPGGDARTPFSHTPFALPLGDRVFYGSGDTFRISALGPTFAHSAELRVPFLDEPLDRAEATRLHDETLALVAARIPADQARARIAQSFDPAVLPERRPSIGRVLADGEGRIWVERFEPMRLGAEVQVPGDRWTVIDTDGRPVARLRVPPRTRLEAVRGDRAAVVRWDEMDEQWVEVRALER